MPNINDVSPDQISTAPPPQAQPLPAQTDSSGLPLGGNINNVHPDQIETAEEHYSSPGQQALTVGEGFAEGALGPAKTLLESGLSGVGIPGLTPADQRARAETNPVEHVGSEVAGFGASILSGLGEAPVLEGIGNAALKTAGLDTAATGVSKLAATGIKTGAEMAALQAGDEISKAINQDPNQTLGSAAVNIGLSGLLGGAGGVAIGQVSNLFKTASNKIGISKMASDFMGEYKLLQDAPDVAATAKSELANRIGEVDELLGNQTAPEVTNVATVDKHLQNLYDAQKEMSDLISKKGVQDIVGSEKNEDWQDAVKKYLSTTQKSADAIAKAHVDAGVEIPLQAQFNSTPAIDSAFNSKITPGKSLAQWVYKQGAENLAESLSKGIGGGAGALISHALGVPAIFGAWAGEKVLGPMVRVLAKPLAEKAIDSEAIKSTIDYVGNSIKGAQKTSAAVKNVFGAADVLPKELLPTTEKRQKLEQSLASLDNPQNMLNVGGKLGHYLPDHGSATATVAATAKNYFDTLRPRQVPMGPFDAVPPIDRVQIGKYKRALDIAQQPLMVLKHVKDGTLTPDDVQTLNTLFPNYHSAMVSKLSNEMVEQKTKMEHIPYAKRMSLSLLMGNAVDSTQTPQSMQAILASSGGQISQTMGTKPPKKATAVELKQINKTNDLYATGSEARLMERRA